MQKEVDIKMRLEGDEVVMVFSLPGASITLRFTDDDDISDLTENFYPILARAGEAASDREAIIEEFIEQMELEL